MRRTFVIGCWTMLWAFGSPFARAEVESGPAVGEKIPELKVATVTGTLEGKEADQAADRQGKPTVYLFIAADKFDRPMARYMKVLDGKVAAISDKAHIVAVWLTDDVNKSKEYLPKAQQSLRLDNTSLCVYPGEKSGPAGWGVNLDAHLTAVVTDGTKVAARFGLVSLNETDVPAVVTAWEKTQEKK